MNTSNFLKLMYRGGITAILLSAVLFSACQKEDPLPTPQEILDETLANVDQAQLAADIAAIDDSLATWGLTDMVRTEPNGVRYILETEGSGTLPNLRSVLRMKYSGRLLSTDTEFDSSDDASLQLNRLIAGFQTALPLVPEGSKVTLYIPSGLGYGSTDLRDMDGNVVIPANSNLIFDIELLEVR